MWRYPSLIDGILATAAELQTPRMAGVVEQLRHPTTLTALYAVINRSAWCPDCQGGRYPLALYQYLRTGGPGPQRQSGPAGLGQLAPNMVTLGGGPGGIPKPTPPPPAYWPGSVWRYFAEAIGITVPEYTRRLSAIARRPHP